MVHRACGERAHGGCPGKWLRTPLGWTRAQLVYDKLSGPPSYGTLLEAMCVLVHRYRQKLELLGARAQAQAALGGEAAEEAFKDFSNFVSRVETEDNTRKMRERLKEIEKIKEIRFRPLVSTKRTLNVPRVSREQVEKSGILDNQLRPVKTRRPKRARRPRR